VLQNDTKQIMMGLTWRGADIISCVWGYRVFVRWSCTVCVVRDNVVTRGANVTDLSSDNQEMTPCSLHRHTDVSEEPV